MTKLEQAARQALEALESYGIDGTKSVGGIKCTEAITALREALDERHKENCACEVCRGCDNADIKAEQAEQEPVAWMNTNGAVNKLREAGWAMNAAPVRTKDLTDEELAKAAGFHELLPQELYIARAAIAADREKNK